MALSEFEIRRMEKLVGGYIETRRPAPHIRGQVDLSFRIKDQSFEIFEVRPQWDDASKFIEGPVARATYVKSKKIWKLYWMRSDFKWHSHTPCPMADSLEEVLKIIDEDAYNCFWG